MHYTRDMAVEILVKAKLIKEAYLTRHAIVLQRAWRQSQWQHAYRGSCQFRRQRKAAMLIQAHYRRRKAIVQVTYFRGLVGTRVKRLLRTTAICCPDVQGRMTMSRAIRADDNVEALPPPLRVMPLVDISAISTAQRAELAFAVAPIQAMARFQFRVGKVQDIQRMYRAHLVRAGYQSRRQKAMKIQAVWRAKIARNRLRRARAAATKIQAQWRRVMVVVSRRRKQEEELAEAFSSLMDCGNEVVDGRRVRSGGSVCN